MLTEQKTQAVCLSLGVCCGPLEKTDCIDDGVTALQLHESSQLITVITHG